MEQLNGLDSLFVYAEQQGLPMSISSVSIYDPSTAPQGELRSNDILRCFEAGMPKSSIFRRRLVRVPGNLGHPYWIDDPDFDMEFHVRHIALPQPGDWRQLCIQLARLQARPIDRNRPLWEAYVIEGLNSVPGVPPGSFALMLKVHHAAMDGLSGLKLFMAMHDLEPKVPSMLREVPDVCCEAPPSRSRLLWKAAGNYTSLAIQSASIAKRNLQALKRVREGLRKGAIHNIPDKAYTRFNVPPSRGRVVGRYAMPLQDCQSLRQLVPGATLNDVMLTVISGAMRSYLSAKEELPSETLVAGCPVDVRTSETRNLEQNLVSMMNVSLCSHIESPLCRLQAIQTEAKRAKDYHRRIGHDTVVRNTALLPPLLVGLGTKGIMQFGRYLPALHNTMASNISGLPVPVYLAGARMIDAFGLGPVLPHCNLFHVISRYCDNISIGFNACRDAMPDPDIYMGCLDSAWSEMQQCLQSPAGNSLRGEKQPETTAEPRNQRKSA